MGKTKIEWTEYSLSPFKGCSKVSSGCRSCYAEVMARRLQAMGKRGYKDVIDKNGWTGRVNFVPEVLDKLAEWKKPKRIFINSMSDTFHENIEKKPIWKLFDAMLVNKQHTYYILTKRPKNIHFLRHETMFYNNRHLDMCDTSHIWLGVTVESQKYVDRIATLCEHWSGKMFVSAEPLLGPLNLDDYIHEIDWLIVGGESGYGARPVHPDWVKSLKDQVLQAGVPFFFKQWGEWIPCWQTPADGPVWIGVIDAATFSRIDKELRKRDPDPVNGMSDYRRVGKKAAGRLLDGQEWNQIPKGGK